MRVIVINDDGSQKVMDNVYYVSCVSDLMINVISVHLYRRLLTPEEKNIIINKICSLPYHPRDEEIQQIMLDTFNQEFKKCK